MEQSNVKQSKQVFSPLVHFVVLANHLRVYFHHCLHQPLVLECNLERTNTKTCTVQWIEPKTKSFSEKIMWVMNDSWVHQMIPNFSSLSLP